MNHALIGTGRGPLAAQAIVRNVGDGARTLCARSAKLPEISEEVDALLALFLDYYGAHPVDFTRWMPGAQETLDQLAEMRLPLGICTNKPRTITESVLGALGIRTRFRSIVAGGDLSEKKPAPGPLFQAAKQLGVAPDLVVMVGDAPQDVECARRAGMRSIAIDSGFAPRERVLDAHPDVFLASLVDLPDVIRRWRDATARVSSVRG
jgi:phosphoglycolate phosphatase